MSIYWNDVLAPFPYLLYDTFNLCSIVTTSGLIQLIIPVNAKKSPPSHIITMINLYRTVFELQTRIMG